MNGYLSIFKYTGRLLLDGQGQYREYPLEVMNASGVRGRESMIYDVSDGVPLLPLLRGNNGNLGKPKLPYIRMVETYLYAMAK